MPFRWDFRPRMGLSSPLISHPVPQRPTRSPSRFFPFRSSRSSWRRQYSDSAGRSNKRASDKYAASPIPRAERILSRLPPSMQKYTRRLRNAPVSHVVAFLILHEITAIIPLFGLFGLFHYTDYVPIDYMMGRYGDQVADGVRRFEKYFRRKGWFGFGEADGSETAAIPERGKTVSTKASEDAVFQKWTSADSKYKIVVEVGLAYAITKVLLPVRIVFSLWGTPWFAGVLARLRGVRTKKTGP